jgi:hypothetical protein
MTGTQLDTQQLDRLDPTDFRGRIWVTRARPYIDRLSSA